MVTATEAARATCAYYDAHAERYWQGTRDHDVSQNVDALLEALGEAGPYRILDFGCGPGRDLRTFCERGHRPVGLDGSARFAAMARAYAGVPVWEQDFLELELPRAEFDGVFANASLFHVPTAELRRVLGALHATLRSDGVLFSSNPRGDNREGWSRGRFGAYHDLARWRGFLEASGFREIRHYYRPPGLPRDQQPWLASLWRRIELPAPSSTTPGDSRPA